MRGYGRPIRDRGSSHKDITVNMHLSRPKSSTLVRLGTLSLALAAAFACLSGTSAQAQTPAATASASLARYVPNRDLILYLEFEGLDNHLAAWKGSAMYKVLNETNTGVMLEDLMAQVFDKSLKSTMPALQKMSGAEFVSLAKTVLSSGFVVGLGGKQGDPNSNFGVVVFRNAFRKETKTVYSKVLAAMNTPTTKASLVTKANHKVVSIVDSKAGPQVDWWVDDVKKEDLIISLRPGSTALILETVDGTQPSAVDNKLRAELAQSAAGMTPIATMFADASVLKGAPLPPALGIDGLQRIDYVWGFQGKESVTIARIIAPKPRKGLLGMFDQPTFAKANMLAVPEGVEGFSAMSIDAGKVLEDVMAMAQSLNPETEAQIKKMMDGFTVKSKVNLKEDVLSQIGPRIAVYNAPASKSTGGFNPLAALTGGSDFPKVTIVAEIQNPTAFARTLDALMIEVNKQLRTAMPTPPAEGANAEAPATKKRADRGGSGLEFKPLPTPTSADRAYMLAIPSQLASFVPSFVRPTVRLHGKSLIISVAADAARQAAELKGAGAAAKEFAETLQPVEGNLISLTVEDPRNTLPALLASLPGKAQALANRAKAGAAGGGLVVGGVPVGAPPAGPQGAGNPDEGDAAAQSGGAGGKGRGNMLGGPPVAPGPGAGGAAGYPGGGPGGAAGYPGGGPGGPPPQSGAPGETAAANGVVFSVDPAKMPKADEIKPLLFPNSTAVVLEDQGIKFVVRESFPNITPLFSIPALGNLPGMGGPGGPPPGGTPPPGFGPAGAPGGNSGGGGGRAGNKLID